MKKCQHCGAPLQDGDRFCQACGAEQLPEEESKKRICPECGKWIQADGKFCPFCGAELPEMDDDEPVIDEATGTETFVHKHSGEDLRGKRGNDGENIGRSILWRNDLQAKLC